MPRLLATAGCVLIAGLYLSCFVDAAHADEIRSWAPRPVAQQHGQDLQTWWQKLPDEERRMLQRGREDFSELSAAKQQRIRERWERYQQMTPAERQRVRERYERWQQMSPAERAKLRETYQRFKDLPPRQRQELRRELHDLKDLPADQRELRRRELRQRYFRDSGRRNGWSERHGGGRDGSRR